MIVTKGCFLYNLQDRWSVANYDKTGFDSINQTKRYTNQIKINCFSNQSIQQYGTLSFELFIRFDLLHKI